MNLALDAMKLAFSGTEECYFSQPPRNCLKTHEDVIVARGTRQSTLCYLPSENKWYKLANMLSNQQKYCQSTSSCHRKMYCIGGNSDGYPAECYDPSTNTWAAMKSFNQAIQFASVVTFQGLLYVIGGRDKNEGKSLNTVQTYNPETNLWQKVGSLSIARGGICAVAGKKFLYAVGGSWLKIVERFDATEKSWSRIAPTLEGRACACGVAVNEKVFVFGGLSTVAHICHGKSYSSTAKRTFPRQNLLFHGKTYFITAKLTFSRQNLLFHGKTYFSTAKLISHGKTYFLTAKLTSGFQSLCVYSSPPLKIREFFIALRSNIAEEEDFV